MLIYLAAKSHLDRLKVKVDKKDITKLETFPDDLSKIDNNVAKKTVCDKLDTKVKVTDINIPGTIGLVLKTQYNSGQQNLEKNIENGSKNIPNASGLVKKIDCNTKVTEIENKMFNVTGLAATTALNKKVTVIENKVLDTSHFINTQEFNTWEKRMLDTRIKEAKMSLAKETEVNNALDLRNKNSKKV